MLLTFSATNDAQYDDNGDKNDKEKSSTSTAINDVHHHATQR